ncbi:MAG: 50S ribosomal protein L23 [Deltaproteobacteria bacterium]|nr:MAG: 50S ribosomal protein L23 [Deltaproteobacteria bacterium]RTZ97827.1 MAG: 50S ribosomal protein L23 [Deltaproteobacteria bacterium]
MIAHDIIRRPIITEKTTNQKEAYNQFSFEVAPKANRVEIKRAIEEVFSVRVSAVKTLHIRGKLKRRGRILGRRRSWKKAIVTLMPGERIEFFEGA